MIICDKNGVEIKNNDLLFSEENVYNTTGISPHKKAFFCKAIQLNNELYFVDCDKDGNYDENQLQNEMNIGSIRERHEGSYLWKKCLATNRYPINFTVISN